MRQFVCSHCGAVNRAPETKDAADAKCGRCHEAIFQAKPTDVSGAELDAHVRNTKGAAVLVDVWASWCGPCKMMAPHFSQAAQTLEPHVRLLKLDSEANREAATRLGVRSIPALYLFRDGKVVAQNAGAMTADQIIAWTERSLAAA